MASRFTLFSSLYNRFSKRRFPLFAATLATLLAGMAALWGLEVHEDPYIVKGNRTPLVLNNVFSIEPGIYMPGKFGVRIEDIVIASKSAGERTCNVTRRYWESKHV